MPSPVGFGVCCVFVSVCVCVPAISTVVWERGVCVHVRMPWWKNQTDDVVRPEAQCPGPPTDMVVGAEVI